MEVHITYNMQPIIALNCIYKLLSLQLKSTRESKIKMQCSKELTLVRFFYNISSSTFLLLLFIYCSSILLTKFFNFIGSYPLIPRSQNEYEYSMFSEEEEVEEEDQVKVYDGDGYFHHYNRHHYQTHEHHLVADIIHGGESLVFLHNKDNIKTHNPHVHEEEEEEEEASMNYGHEHRNQSIREDDEKFHSAQDSSSPCSESEPADGDHDQNLHAEEETHHDQDSDHDGSTSPLITRRKTTTFVNKDKTFDDESCSDDDKETVNSKKVEANFSGDDNFLVFAPTRLVSEKIKAIRLGKEKFEEDDREGIFGDSCTVGSTSKSSSEWRSSINCRDSGTDQDPFSSSSRRSCPKWESYTVFQKYDEEMMFLDRVSAQKLHEAESLRSIQVCPRSISERLVHKFAKKPPTVRNNPYHELEATYVAQICLTWEALNWNYKNFQRKFMTSARRELDPGCPADVAQQFQQFQVLLQRYIENEPYEQGRRPEVYARMRLLAPKLLLVPEYRDPDYDQNKIKDESFASRISSASFMMILEEGIRTFMNFLKADKEKPCQILRNFFGRNRRGSVDPSLLNLMKKVNTKKRKKLKDIRRARNNCIRKRRLTVEEEIEILMCLIDLKVVSRVLRMADLSEEQMHWCEGKMSKVRISDGKLQRDSSPLFFPAH